MSRSSRKQKRSLKTEQAELNITPFMNLMIVLVPVLLLSMVFTHIRVHQVEIPQLAQKLQNQTENKTLQLVIRQDGFEVQYPAGSRLKVFNTTESNIYPYEKLGVYLRNVKLTFQKKNIEKNDITLLADDKTPYQVLVKTLDQIKFSKETIEGKVVYAELFPQVSLGSL